MNFTNSIRLWTAAIVTASGLITACGGIEEAGENHLDALAQDPNYGICPEHRRSSSGFQRNFQNTITRQYHNEDWNGVKRSLRSLAVGGPLLGRQRASDFLNRFLDSRGDYHHDTSNSFGGPATASSWIGNAINTVRVTDRMDQRARTEIERRLANGQKDGFVTIRDDVATNAAEDGDLYYALGKFAIQGNYEFETNRGFLGLQGERTIMKRKYTATDRYDWDPPRQCGIVDHIIPWALEQAGHARSFNAVLKWARDDIRLR